MKSKGYMSYFNNLNQTGSLKKNVLIGVVFLLLIAGIIGVTIYLFNKGVIPRPPQKEPVALPLVIINNIGFFPETIQIKKGDTIQWTNQDTAGHQVASDPYPTHATLPGLFSTALLNGQSYTFKFTEAGTFTYQDYLNPLKFKGTVIVE